MFVIVFCLNMVSPPRAGLFHAYRELSPPIPPRAFTGLVLISACSDPIRISVSRGISASTSGWEQFMSSLTSHDLALIDR